MAADHSGHNYVDWRMRMAADHSGHNYVDWRMQMAAVVSGHYGGMRTAQNKKAGPLV